MSKCVTTLAESTGPDSHWLLKNSNQWKKEQTTHIREVAGVY
jgi:hypothetical protein